MTSNVRIRRLVASVVVVFGVVVAGAAPAGAAGAADGCAGDVGTRTPVLFVHGFTSSGGTWGEADDPGTAMAAFCTTSTYSAAFDYAEASTRWVTDDRIGPALATRILELADESTRDGGQGKVVLVGHSMGGLAIRCAAAEACNGGRRGVPGAIATIVTFGTPHQGTFWKRGPLGPVTKVLGKVLSESCTPAESVPVGGPVLSLTGLCGYIDALGASPAANAFEPGSDELDALPDQPSGIPVTSVAGKIDVTTNLFFKRIKLADVGDAVVGVRSAHAQHAEHLGIGGAPTVDCGTIDVTVVPITAHLNTSCWHGGETGDPRFLAHVKQAVDTWSALPEPTRIVYTGPVDQTGHLYPNQHVTLTPSGGTCEPDPVFVPGTYRCSTTDFGLFSPCWAGIDDTGSDIAVCMSAPWVGTLTTVSSVEGLGTAGGTDYLQTEPWGVKIDNNRLCLRQQGPPDRTDGRPVNYVCDGNQVLLGEIDRNEGRWQADTALFTSGGTYLSTGPHGITFAYYGQPSPS
ncbi:MAG: hypothetical protein GEV28_36860 [Actinophytocola sp.]|uniref:esterase/lipase family protein n=1 Tax=Actinophytocola sp. TaxID=1872138 RepID=UPI001328CCA3|nr:hypothetical protein [Actinophytocola sp.]MPZ85655.1 hypothetical protein [Actinophytocola sp.]